MIMNILNMDISKELKSHIEDNQTQLKNAIRNHQILITKLKVCIDLTLCKDIQKNIEEAQQQIVIIGLEQKDLIDKLRHEIKANQRNIKANTFKNGIEERRFNLSSALIRARKQNIITRASSVQSASPSEESELPSSPPTPEPTVLNPLVPQDLTQTDFLTYFGLATHDVYKEIQNKRAERKRRRTANPQFLYTRGWDISVKRKRNLYLASNVSPPNTRQSVKNKRGSSPTFKASRPSSPNDAKKSSYTLERINLTRVSADSKTCLECRSSTDPLVVCEVCTNGFHVSCHNRPLVQTPKHCPKCYKDLRIGSSNPIDLTVVLDKIKQKDDLLEKNRELCAELTQLQDKHSKLTISLKTHETKREELMTTSQTTEDKIKKLLSFITNIKDDVIVKKEIKEEVDEPASENMTMIEASS